MQCLENISETISLCNNWQSHGNSIALVPTMGNLHNGHLSLVRKARDIADKIIVSIFVNPTQFVEGEDFDSYPRTLNSDFEKLSEEKVDLIFTPLTDQIYSRGTHQTKVSVTGIEDLYCGASRPGHFAGVATIVLKLFNITRPDFAVFGEKDYQQLHVIRKLVTDLFLPIEIIAMPTIREEDGLAMSSRNQYLSKEQRLIAPCLYQILQETAAAVNTGSTEYKTLENQAVAKINSAGFSADYVVICDANSLLLPGNNDLVLLAAANLGNARLIDNILIRR